MTITFRNGKAAEISGGSRGCLAQQRVNRVRHQRYSCRRRQNSSDLARGPRTLNFFLRRREFRLTCEGNPSDSRSREVKSRFNSQVTLTIVCSITDTSHFTITGDFSVRWRLIVAVNLAVFVRRRTSDISASSCLGVSVRSKPSLSDRVFVFLGSPPNSRRDPGPPCAW